MSGCTACVQGKKRRIERETGDRFIYSPYVCAEYFDLNLMALIAYNRAQLEGSCSRLHFFFYLRLWTEKTANSFIFHIKTSSRMNNKFVWKDYLGLNQQDYEPSNINVYIDPVFLNLYLLIADLTSKEWFTMRVDIIFFLNVMSVRG